MYHYEGEEGYLQLIRRVLKDGEFRNDRTGTGTKALFGCSLEFDLSNGTFPLITTKKMFWKGIAEELLWFISGDVNSNTLSEKGVKIWDLNGSREYLDRIGLTNREQGDLGPVYGFQWRHFGATYKTMHDDYTGQGIDQLTEVINTIKTKPTDRRIILSAWNPSDIKLMALPPCHMMAQFYVSTAKKSLSCQMTQRSCDLGLGVPFNIASYALLTYLIASICDLKPERLVMNLGDTHVYVNHEEGLLEQVNRTPKPFPKLFINKTISPDTTIDGFKFEDLTLLEYSHHPPISLPMSV